MRLTDKLRNEIRQNAMAQTYTKALETQRKALWTKGHEVYTRALLDKYPFDRIPEVYLHENNCLDIVFPAVKGENHIVTTLYPAYLAGKNPCNSHYNEAAPRFFARTLYLKDHPVSKKLQQELLEAHNQLQETLRKRRELDQQINSVLLSVNTVNQLLDVWPECEQYLPIIPSKTGFQLTVRVESLNAELAHARS